jgi:cobalamin-dependent methionine synthase I
LSIFDKTGTREAAGDEKVDPTAGMTPDQRVHWMIVHRKKDGIEVALDAAGVREAPVRVLNEVLLPAMKEVGDKFGAGELILPFVLQSAEVMKKAVKHLEGFLERAEGYTKGKVVLATVYGDVHDIGKSLVNTILSNNGYTVFDLGKQVPVNTIIDKAIEVGADAIGSVALARVDVEANAAVRAGARPSRNEDPGAHRWARRSIVASAVARCSSKVSAHTPRVCSTARTRSRDWRLSTACKTRRRARPSRRS